MMSQWEEEKILGFEGFGEMTWEKWREGQDWRKVSRRTLGTEEVGIDDGKSRKERDDW